MFTAVKTAFGRMHGALRRILPPRRPPAPPLRPAPASRMPFRTVLEAPGAPQPQNPHSSMSSPQAPLDGPQGFEALSVLATLLGPEPKTRHVRQVGRQLALLIRRAKPFTASYVYNVLAGRYEPSPEFRLALEEFWTRASGSRPPFPPSLEEVPVKAVPGKVEPGSYIAGASIRCTNPGCQRPFVPASASQRYCTPRCRVEGARHRA